MFTHYNSNTNWGLIWFLSISFLILGLFCALFAAGIREHNQIETFKHECIDAGGYPVAPFDYVRGHGEGYLCINPSAIINMEK